MMLSDYLDQVAARGFAYGDLDCCTLMADWLTWRGLPDAMADRRASYASYRQYRALMRAEGGIVASCGRRFAAVGLSALTVPVAGDVCLVKAPVLVRRDRIWWGVTGAIAVSDRLRAVVTPDAGLVIAELDVVSAWGLA